MKRLSSLGAAAVLTLWLCLSAFAETPYVRFQGQGAQGSFSFGPAADGDLFRSMKDMMPGETRTQPIRVENNASDSTVLVLYLRSDWNEGADTLRLRPWLTVDYRLDGGEGFQEAAVPPGRLLGELHTGGITDPDMTRWICLGTLQPGGWADLTARVTLSPEADNTAADAAALVDLWVQAVFPEPETLTDGTPEETGGLTGLLTTLLGHAPQTGDGAAIGLILAAAGAALALLLAAALKKSHQKGKTE